MVVSPDSQHPHHRRSQRSAALAAGAKSHPRPRLNPSNDLLKGKREMKKQMSAVLLLSSWIFVAVIHGAQPQPSGDVSARVFNSADISVPQMRVGEWKTLTFDSERWDSANLHDIAASTGRVKAPVAGKYTIFANITWETPLGSGFWGLRLLLNGKTPIAEQTLPNNGS